LHGRNSRPGAEVPAFAKFAREEPYNVVLYREMMFSVFKLGSVAVGSAVFTALVIVFCKYTCWCGL
jgi:hypothetical protein